MQMCSDNYVGLTFMALKQAMDNGAVAAVTLCLTPDAYTPGWEATEAFATRALTHLGLEWRLPRPRPAPAIRGEQAGKFSSANRGAITNHSYPLLLDFIRKSDKAHSDFL